MIRLDDEVFSYSFSDTKYSLFTLDRDSNPQGKVSRHTVPLSTCFFYGRRLKSVKYLFSTTCQSETVINRFKPVPKRKIFGMFWCRPVEAEVILGKRTANQPTAHILLNCLTIALSFIRSEKTLSDVCSWRDHYCGKSYKHFTVEWDSYLDRWFMKIQNNRDSALGQ